MILGLGTDIINVERVEKLFGNFETKFQTKFFTKNEIQSSKRYKNVKQIYSHFAKRFAAKEAFAKALGLGIGRGINFQDIEIKNNKHGKPYIEKNDILSKNLQEIFHLELDKIKIDLSMSDDYPFAQATVIISKI